MTDAWHRFIANVKLRRFVVLLCTMASSANDELDPVYIYPNIYCY